MTSEYVHTQQNIKSSYIGQESMMG